MSGHEIWAEGQTLQKASQSTWICPHKSSPNSILVTPFQFPSSTSFSHQLFPLSHLVFLILLLLKLRLFAHMADMAVQFVCISVCERVHAGGFYVMELCETCFGSEADSNTPVGWIHGLCSTHLMLMSSVFYFLHRDRFSFYLDSFSLHVCFKL